MKTEANVRRLFSNLCEDQVNDLLRECASAVYTFHETRYRSDFLPTDKEARLTLEKISSLSRELVKRLEQAGGVEDDISREAEKQGHPAPSLLNLQFDLEHFSNLAHSASARPRVRANDGIKLKSPRRAAAGVLASAYRRIIGDEPTYTPQSDAVEASIYVRLIKAVIEDCEGFELEFTKFEPDSPPHQGFKDYKAGRAFHSTGVPDLHEPEYSSEGP